MKLNLVSLGLIFILIGCGMNVEKKTLATTPSVTPTFKLVQEQVINVNCLQCHKSGGAASAFPFTSYDEVIFSGGIAPGKPDSSDLYNDISAGIMPKGGTKLDASLIALVRNWIQAGALNN